MISRRLTTVIVIAVLSVLIPLRTLAFFGHTYTYSIPNPGFTNADDFDILVENADDSAPEDAEDIIKATKSNITTTQIAITLEARNRGRVFVEIIDKDGAAVALEKFYVHGFNIITEGAYFGPATGDVSIPLCLIILCATIFAFLIQSYRQNTQKNLYSYQNITRLGMIIFLGFIIITLTISAASYRGIIGTISGATSIFTNFATILLPIIFVLSIFVTITSLILIKKEGFTWRNLLGVILGLFLLVTTIVPEIMNQILQTTELIDIHNETSIWPYVQTFAEAVVGTTLTYIEAVLVATIAVTLKVAYHLPPLNQDYVLILGCYVNPDGTPGGLLKKRADAALAFAQKQASKTGNFPMLICSGGKGIDEPITEAESIKNYLIERGANSRKILMETRSKTTAENLKFSNELIKKHAKTPHPKIAFTTTSYHVFRAGYLASTQGFHFNGIGAKTKTYFWINAFIREFIAEMVLERKRHIITIVLLWLFALINVAIRYIAQLAS